MLRRRLERLNASEVRCFVSHKGLLILEGRKGDVRRLIEKLREAGLDFKVEVVYCG